MKCYATWRREKPDTTSGEKIIMTQVFTSFDKQEIDKLEETLKETIKSGIFTDFEVKTNE